MPEAVDPEEARPCLGTVAATAPHDGWGTPDDRPWTLWHRQTANGGRPAATLNGGAGIRFDKLGGRETDLRQGRDRGAKRQTPQPAARESPAPCRSRRSWPGSSIPLARSRRRASKHGTTLAARRSMRRRGA
jgi:hypothetical protein